MAKATILLVDNDFDFLETRSAFLQSKGYEVIATENLQEAESKFETEKINLVVIDVRLVDDDDKEDLSGLELARGLPTSTPIIILTNRAFPNTFRNALGTRGQKEPLGIEFIAKREEPSVLLATIQNLLKNSLSGDSTTDAPPLEDKKKKKPKGK
jgi:DNA-binding response OmpR family regulator